MRNGVEDSEKEKLNPKDRWQATRPSQQFNVIRRVYQQDALNKDANYQVPKKPLIYRCKKIIRNCGFGDCLLHSLPIARWLPRYNPKRDLMGDLVAGATTAVMHIPQGMAYAILAEIPPIVGLYMAFFPVLIYAIFGTSPHVSMGTFAVACLMTGKVVLQQTAPVDIDKHLNSTGSPLHTPIEIASALSLTVGLMHIAMWMLRLGAVSTLLSEPLVSGFTTAASFHVMASQLKDLFGIRLPRLGSNYKVIFTVIEIFKNLTKTNLAAFVISVITCTIIALNNEILKPWVSKRCRVPVPIELLAIVIGTLASQFGNLKGVYGLSLVGTIPTGLPYPSLPPLDILPEIALDAFTMTIVTYTITISMALIFASKAKYEIDANQELLAMGASNVFGSFFLCAPLCASLSRSYIQYQAGSKTCLTTVVSASLIVCVLLWVGPFFEMLPRCVLASIIVVSLKGMFMQIQEFSKFWKLSKLDAMVWFVTFLVTLLVNIDIGKTCLTTVVSASLIVCVLLWVGPFFEMLPRCVLASIIVVSLKGMFMQIQEFSKFWKLSKLDAMVWFVTFLVTLLVNIDIGLGAGLLASVGALFCRSQKPYTCLLGRVLDTDLYLDIKRYRGAEEIAGIKIFHYCGGLNFASKNLFRSTLFRKIGYLKEKPMESSDSDSNTKTESDLDANIADKVQCVIIDATALSYVDAPGVRSLEAAQRELVSNDITVLLAGANGPVLEMIETYNSLESERLQLDTFPTVHDAVVYFKMLEAKKSSAITITT